jgi:hypothetical protein
MRRTHRCFQRNARSRVLCGVEDLSFSSIERKASRIACASFALAPTVPPSPLVLVISQNQDPPLLQTAKSTPRWRLRLHEPLLIIHLLVKILASTSRRRRRLVLRASLASSKPDGNWLHFGDIREWLLQGVVASSGSGVKFEGLTWRLRTTLRPRTPTANCDQAESAGMQAADAGRRLGPTNGRKKL